MKKYIFGLVSFLILVGCNTETFDFEKLSSQTGLTPEIQLPVAQIELGIKSFLDSLDLEVDDERDAYGTIYLKEHIDDVGSVELSDVLDINEFASDFNTTYSLEPIALENASIFSETVSFSQISTFPDGSSLNDFPAFPSQTIDMGATSFMDSSYDEATLQSGVLAFDLQNRFPIPITTTVRLEDSAGNALVSSSPKQLAVNESAEVIVDLANVSLPNSISIVMDISSVGTTSPITIDYATQEFSIDVSHRNVALSKVTIASPVTLAFSFDQDVGFDAPNGERLSQLNLETAKFNFEVKHDFNAPSQLSLRSPDMQVAGTPFERTYNISASPNTQNFDWDMNAVEIQFSQSGTESLFKLQYDLNLNLQPGFVLETNKSIELSGSFSALELDSVFGDFGTTTNNLNEVVDISEDFSDYIGKIHAFEPRVELLIYNTFGIPASYALEANAHRKDGSSLHFQTPPLDPVILAPVQFRDTAVTRVTYDNTNSNIEAFLSFLPDDRVDADLTVTLNPDGPAIPPNFLHKHSRLWFDAELEAPLHFKVTDLTVHDTVHFEPPLKDEEDIDRILAASLRMHFTSDIPLNTVIHTTLIDTLSKDVLADFDTFKMETAPVNSEGEVTGSATYTSEFMFSNDNIMALKQGNGLAIAVELNTADNQNNGVKISSSAKIKLNTAAKIKVQLDE